MSRASRSSATISVNATRAKNEFGLLLERAVRGGRVVVTKRDVPAAVLVSVEELDRLERADEAALAALARVFDSLMDRMQGSQARAAVKAAFSASPEELGKAAVRAARGQRGR